MNKQKKIIMYSDELHDEFSRAEITPKIIDENYPYLVNSYFWNLNHFFLYRIIATPFAFLYCKLKHHIKIVNRRAFKAANKDEGYFIYANHTQETADAFIPTLATFPKQVFVIVHPNNVSMPVLGKLTPFLGAIPLPSDIKATRNFLNCLEKRIIEGRCIAIYPEAHIWPYYTKIRPFPAASFRYPIKYDTPSFCLTNTYQKQKNSDKPKITTYIDGPFYPNKHLVGKEQETDLRNQIYNCMVNRSKESNYEYVTYIKKESK